MNDDHLLVLYLQEFLSITFYFRVLRPLFDVIHRDFPPNTIQVAVGWHIQA